jgi:hypothetical protein
MPDPKNPGYKLVLEESSDPDVVRVFESDDVDGPAPVRTVSAVEAGRLWHSQEQAPRTLRAAPAKKAAPVKKAAAKKTAKRG